MAIHRFARALLVMTALTLPLAACEAVNNFDPTELVPSDIFGSKKKLPGERKAMFPEGVPGLERGVPAELVRDGQQPGADDVRAPAQRAAVEPEPKPKPKARPKPPPKQQATAPEPAPPPSQAPVAVRPTPQAPRQPAPQWPDPPGAKNTPAAPGGVQWPDPPPTPR